MKKIERIASPATVFRRPNVDTDVIIPARHLKTLTRDGLGPVCFEGERYDAEGRVRNDSPFERAARGEHRILLAGPNFGCGSSREHAVWALMALGFEAVIAPSFADIFSDNSVRNGLLLATVSPEDWARLADAAEAGATIAINLPTQEITAGAVTARFAIEEERKRRLIEGLDAIAETLADEAMIAEFEARDREARPWLVG